MGFLFQINHVPGDCLCSSLVLYGLCLQSDRFVPPVNEQTWLFRHVRGFYRFYRPNPFMGYFNPPRVKRYTLVWVILGPSDGVGLDGL